MFREYIMGITICPFRILSRNGFEFTWTQNWHDVWGLSFRVTKTRVARPVGQWVRLESEYWSVVFRVGHGQPRFWQTASKWNENKERFRISCGFIIETGQNSHSLVFGYNKNSYNFNEILAKGKNIGKRKNAKRKVFWLLTCLYELWGVFFKSIVTRIHF